MILSNRPKKKEEKKEEETEKQLPLIPKIEIHREAVCYLSEEKQGPKGFEQFNWLLSFNFHWQSKSDELRKYIFPAGKWAYDDEENVYWLHPDIVDLARDYLKECYYTVKG